MATAHQRKFGACARSFKGGSRAKFQSHMKSCLRGGKRSTTKRRKSRR